MAGELNGKVTLVTGAACGIGKAAALLFAQEGGRLMLADIDGDGAERTAALVRANGGEAQAMRTDVTDRRAVNALVAATMDAYGDLECAFNNAGTGHAPTSLLDMDDKVWDWQIALNLSSVLYCMQAQIPIMIERGGGRIVNTASLAGMAATPKMSGYCAAKHGLIGLSKTAAAEFVGQNIRVNLVCPTATASEGMLEYIEKSGADPARFNGPMGRMGQPVEQAQVALWLLSDRSSYVTGQAIVANGGSGGQTA